ncbi:hypothetical protein C0993_001507 [Termitomyces sp. T159_Od127]|nr:hypothetical protein C0993_001507 [Termitomyces sp. T159_Od127]
MTTDSSESVTYKNRHDSVDSNGDPVQHLIYISEPLGHPAAEGYGWPRFEFEQVVGKGQWVLKRKLGWGMSASIWLAYDQILKGKGQDGYHICYVTPLLGGNVEGLLSHLSNRAPYHVIKRILLHTLRGLAHMHEHGYIHTDLKLDNIFFSTNMSTQDIRELLENDPPRLHDPEYSPDGIIQAAVSQPLPYPPLEEAMKCTFLLGDYSHAEPISKDLPLQTIAIPPNRPPENVILAPWNEKADIWAFGCLVFQLVTGRMLFDWKRLPEYQLNEEANLLYQMMNVTGERFSAAQLSGAKKTDEYFDKDGDLLSKPPYMDHNYRSQMEKLVDTGGVDIASICQLLSRCLRLNADDRSHAIDLLSDPFFVGSD